MSFFAGGDTSFLCDDGSYTADTYYLALRPSNTGLQRLISVPPRPASFNLDEVMRRLSAQTSGLAAH
jgi:hypothetical protein